MLNSVLIQFFFSSCLAGADRPGLYCGRDGVLPAHLPNLLPIYRDGDSPMLTALPAYAELMSAARSLERASLAALLADGDRSRRLVLRAGN